MGTCRHMGALDHITAIIAALMIKAAGCISSAAFGRKKAAAPFTLHININNDMFLGPRTCLESRKGQNS